MVKFVIFDVDGTLVDSVDQHAEAWRLAFEQFDHEIPFADIRQQIGKGGDQLLPVFLSPEEVKSRGEKISEARGKIFKAKFLPGLKAFPDVPALFKELTGRGMRIALASSAKKDELQAYKRIAGIEEFIDEETSTDDAEKSKPDPDIFLAALDRLGNPPKDQAIVIGDTPYDAEAAAKAGLKTIGVLCGGFPEESLRKAGAVAVYQDPGDLLRNVDKAFLFR